MEYVQGGAEITLPRDVRYTKSQLKKAIKDDPSKVYLYDTSAFGSKFSGPASNLPKDYCFNVVGPDPYSKRNWYASIKQGRNGLVVT